MPMEPSSKAEHADMEDGRRRLVAGAIFEALVEIEDMSSIVALSIEVLLDEPGQLSGRVAVQVAYRRDVMAMARQKGDSLN